MKQAIVYNEMEGENVPIRFIVLRMYRRMRHAERAFKIFAEAFHDHESIDSADTYLMLLNEWYETKKQFVPYINEWCITVKGYSLN